MIPKVYRIEDGTVIDHIPGGKALKVSKILQLEEHEDVITLGMRLESKKLGKKDIIKIEHREVTPAELNKIAIIAPQATINIIKDGKPVQKSIVELPRELIHLIICPNPNCISNHERDMQTKFISQSTFTCYYCDTQVDRNQVELW